MRLVRWCLLAWLLCFFGCGGGDPAPRDAAQPQGDAVPDPLIAACLPTCMVRFYDRCPLAGGCVAQRQGAEVALCYGNGVTVRRVEGDAGIVETVYAPDGSPCLRRVSNLPDVTYERLDDGRTARLNIVSHELRTAFCDGETYTDVYRIPGCEPLEEVRCPVGTCAGPRP